MNDISSDMNVQVQPKIGAVPGGGEAKQYFIVCKHKPLFKISSFRSGLFSCSQHIIVLIWPTHGKLVMFFISYKIIFWNDQILTKKTANYIAFVSDVKRYSTQ